MHLKFPASLIYSVSKLVFPDILLMKDFFLTIYDRFFLSGNVKEVIIY